MMALVGLICDEYGEVYAVPGHITPIALLRKIMVETGMCWYEIVDFGAGSRQGDLREWIAAVRHRYMRMGTEEEARGAGWPHGEYYVWCEKDDFSGFAVTAWEA